MKPNQIETIKVSLEKTYSQLRTWGQARLESEILLAHVLKVARSHLLAWPEQILTLSQIQHLEVLVQRRLQGESIAHILGEKEFWSLTLEVTKDTLIPRPDTELLVEKVLEILDKNTTQIIADLGTGSGAIALAIASERPHWHILATDLYPDTVSVAKRNANRLNIKNVEFYQGRWFEALPVNRLNAVISNPPYLALTDPHLKDLAFEPQPALVSGKEGLDDLNYLINHAKAYLVSGGYLFLEHGCGQAEAVRERMRLQPFQDITTYQDLSGHPRVTYARR